MVTTPCRGQLIAYVASWFPITHIFPLLQSQWIKPGKVWNSLLSTLLDFFEFWQSTDTEVRIHTRINWLKENINRFMSMAPKYLTKGQKLCSNYLKIHWFMVYIHRALNLLYSQEKLWKELATSFNENNFLHLKMEFIIPEVSKLWYCIGRLTWHSTKNLVQGDVVPGEHIKELKKLNLI